MADLVDCASEPGLLSDAVKLENFSKISVLQSGLTVIGSQFHQFQPSGCTGFVLLAESHLALHTWPEHRFVALDLYVCNHLTDNTEKAQLLFDLLLDAFKPSQILRKHVQRARVTHGP